MESSVDGSMSANVILHGRGMRGMAHVGALTVAAELGYRWVNIAGTSSGAIIAAMLAAGYTARELAEIVSDLDYGGFADDAGFSVGSHRSRPRGKYIEQFVGDQMRAKGVWTFGDLSIPGRQANSSLRYKLTLFARDITSQRILRLPAEGALYTLNLDKLDLEEAVLMNGLVPDELEVAYAVLMSSIDPELFEPVALQLLPFKGDYAENIGDFEQPPYQEMHQISGVGLLDAASLAVFNESQHILDLPTFNIRIVDDPIPSEGTVSPVFLYKPMHQMMQVMWSVNAANPPSSNRFGMDDLLYACTIDIPSGGISADAINLSRDQTQTLYKNGRRAAQTFFSTWDFEAYKIVYASDFPFSAAGGNVHEAMKQAARDLQRREEKRNGYE